MSDGPAEPTPQAGHIEWEEWVSDILLQVLRSALAPQSAVYVGGPITSGETLYVADSTDSRVEMIAHNRKRMRTFCEELRSRTSSPVIDSSLLTISGWKGRHYSAFFLQVIEQFAKEVIFLRGWQFSRGATKEFLRVLQRGIPCSQEDGSALTLHEGIGLVGDAVGRLRALRLDASGLETRLKQLQSLERTIRGL